VIDVLATAAAVSPAVVTVSVVSNGTGSRRVAMPGPPANASRSISASFSGGASLFTAMAMVTFWKPDGGASGIMWPRTSKFVRATASKLS
jgi:hypothetical protein